MQKGDVVPDFTLPDQTGAPRSLSGFLANGPVVLFFYPAAMTYGCTKESCHFRDMAGEFAAVGAQPVGISADAVEKQKQFDEKESLGFPSALRPRPRRGFAARRQARRELPAEQTGHFRHRHRPYRPRRHPYRGLHGSARRQGARRPEGAIRCLTAPSSSPAPPRASAPPRRRGCAPRAGTSSASTRTRPMSWPTSPRPPAAGSPSRRRPSVAAARSPASSLVPGSPARPTGRARCWRRSTTSAPSTCSTVCVRLLDAGWRRRGDQLELDHCAARHPRRPRRACLRHDEELSAQIADAHTSLVAYPAAKLALAHWVRRNATGPDWAGSGLRLNAIAPGMIDTPMVAGMRADPEAGPLLDMLPIPGRPARPARGDRRPGGPPPRARRRVLLRIGRLLRRRERRAPAHERLARGVGHLGARTSAGSSPDQRRTGRAPLRARP